MSLNEMRRLAVSMFDAAVQAAQPARLSEEAIKVSVNEHGQTQLTMQSIKPIKQSNNQNVSSVTFNLSTNTSINQSMSQPNDAVSVSNITVIAIGKASLLMASALQKVLGPWITDGLIVTTHELLNQSLSASNDQSSVRLEEVDRSIHASLDQSIKYTLNGIPVIGAGHPVLDDHSIEAGELIYQIINQPSTSQSGRLIILLLSGGASALCELPHPPLTLPMLQSINQSMLHAGLNIQSINQIRKRLSLIKGGGLVNMINQSNNQLNNRTSLVGLILSDVVGDDIETIGSGPSVVQSNNQSVSQPIDATASQRMNARDRAIAVLDQYNLRSLLPPVAIEIIERSDNTISLTSSQPINQPINQSINQPITQSINQTINQSTNQTKNTTQVVNLLIGSSFKSLQAASHLSKAAGYNTLILTDRLTGEVSNAAELYHSIINSLIDYDIPIQKPAAIIVGGETTVTIKQSINQTNSRSIGLGGRNQHLAACVARLIARTDDHSNQSNNQVNQIVFLSAGTDGRDGPTDAAGVVVDQSTVSQSLHANLNIEQSINQFDSFTFFSELDRLADQPINQSINQTNNNVPHLIVTGMTGTNVQDVAIVLVR